MNNNNYQTTPSTQFSTMLDASDILAPSELENSDLLKLESISSSSTTTQLTNTTNNHNNAADDGEFSFDLASKSLLFMTAAVNKDTQHITTVNSELDFYNSSASSSTTSNTNSSNISGGCSGNGGILHQSKLAINLTGNTVCCWSWPNSFFLFKSLPSCLNGFIFPSHLFLGISISNPTSPLPAFCLPKLYHCLLLIFFLLFIAFLWFFCFLLFFF